MAPVRDILLISRIRGQCVDKCALNPRYLPACPGVGARGGGGGLPYESDGDARRKIRINTLKETNLGVAPALFNP